MVENALICYSLVMKDILGKTGKYRQFALLGVLTAAVYVLGFFVTALNVNAASKNMTDFVVDPSRDGEGFNDEKGKKGLKQTEKNKQE